MCHVPVRTTTFPFARSAYTNSSSSEMIVVIARVRYKENVKCNRKLELSALKNISPHRLELDPTEEGVWYRSVGSPLVRLGTTQRAGTPNPATTRRPNSPFGMHSHIASYTHGLRASCAL
jgi:hypothetical protein